MRLPTKKALIGYSSASVREAAQKMQADYEQRKSAAERELAALLDEIAELERRIEQARTAVQ